LQDSDLVIKSLSYLITVLTAGISKSGSTDLVTSLLPDRISNDYSLRDLEVMELLVVNKRHQRSRVGDGSPRLPLPRIKSLYEVCERIFGGKVVR
jgi:hypothetical protein